MRGPTARTRRGRGWVAAEALVATVLLTMIMLGVSATINAAGRVNRLHLLRQQCTAAGLAQLESLSATGEVLTDEQFRRLWPKLTCRIERTAGEGDWAGLVLCKAVVSGKARELAVTVTLARYLPAGEAKP